MVLKSLLVGVAVIGVAALRYGLPAIGALVIRRRKMEEAMYHYKEYRKR